MTFGQLSVNGKFRLGKLPEGTLYTKVLLVVVNEHYQYNAIATVMLDEGIRQKRVYFPDNTLVFSVVPG
ncbi:MAG: hypothetical protein WA057_04105 [Candidatus Magasanikiibacteriota bacterium]